MTAAPESPQPDGRDPRNGRFAPGNAGRPRGARHAFHVALDAIGEAEGKAVVRTVIARALEGDTRAADILLRRLWPERKGRPVVFDLPPMKTSADLVAGLAAVAGAVASGDLSPEEAQAVAAVLETQRKAIETAALEDRIAALEARQGGAA